MMKLGKDYGLKGTGGLDLKNPFALLNSFREKEPLHLNCSVLLNCSTTSDSLCTFLAKK